jgi:ubiquinone/menaquinone biosynthesis C-methylase UbiE
VRPNPRLELVVEHLDARPSDHVVEVGCGHGVAATLVLERLTSGTYTGIDRSATMIAASERRNAREVTAGRACFVSGSFADVELGDGRFDRLFAARVVAMTRPAELAAAARCLTPGGMLLLALDAPSDDWTAGIAAAATTSLRAAGFAPPRRIEARLDSELLVFLSAVRP